MTIGAPLTGNLTSAAFEDPDAEFVAARDRLQAAAGVNPSPGIIALVEAGSDVRAAAARAAVERAAAAIAADEATLAGYADELRALPGAAVVTEPTVVGDDTWRIDVHVAEGACRRSPRVRLVGLAGGVQGPARVCIGRY